MEESLQIVFTDLDGTLLNSSRKISRSNLHCLEELGRRQIVRVIATGRSLYSYRKLADEPLPVDYLIFSNGAGMIRLENDKLLHSASLQKTAVQRIATYLINNKIDFMVHLPIPENHSFLYHRANTNNNDFQRRIDLYQFCASEMRSVAELPTESAQVIAIFPNDLKTFNRIKQGLHEFQVTRTTSPLDGSSIWMEIYPAGVSKGCAARMLCDLLGIQRGTSLGVGNDYNDISLLDFTQFKFVVANAPEDMQQSYGNVPTNNCDGFAAAVQPFLTPAPNNQSPPEAR